jgi:hypothetical protein
MKKILFFSLFLIPFILQGLLERISLNNYYESNILSLSEYLKDEFSDNQNPAKYEINSIDDWITSASFSLQYRHFIRKHTQIIRFNGTYNKFWNNSIKDNGYMGISVRQFFNKQFNIAVFYYYYPELYVAHYRSVLDQSQYRSFTYARNNFFTIWSLKLSKRFELRYRFDFDQLFYNKYFTEYDAENVTNKLDGRWQISSAIRFNAAYSYRISHAKAENAYQNSSITDYKDPSYNLNSYEIGLLFPKLLIDIDLQIGFWYDEKFYKSLFSDNTYHYSRDEFSKKFQLSLTKEITKHWQLQPSFDYLIRTVRSPYQVVVRDKEFTNYKIGLQIHYFVR